MRSPRPDAAAALRARAPPAPRRLVLLGPAPAQTAADATPGALCPLPPAAAPQVSGGAPGPRGTRGGLTPLHPQTAAAAARVPAGPASARSRAPGPSMQTPRAPMPPRLPGTRPAPLFRPSAGSLSSPEPCRGGPVPSPHGPQRLPGPPALTGAAAAHGPSDKPAAGQLVPPVCTAPPKNTPHERPGPGRARTPSALRCGRVRTPTCCSASAPGGQAPSPRESRTQVRWGSLSEGEAPAAGPEPATPSGSARRGRPGDGKGAPSRSLCLPPGPFTEPLAPGRGRRCGERCSRGAGHWGRPVASCAPSPVGLASALQLRSLPAPCSRKHSGRGLAAGG